MLVPKRQAIEAPPPAEGYAPCGPPDPGSFRASLDEPRYIPDHVAADDATCGTETRHAGAD